MFLVAEEIDFGGITEPKSSRGVAAMPCCVAAPYYYCVILGRQSVVVQEQDMDPLGIALAGQPRFAAEIGIRSNPLGHASRLALMKAGRTVLHLSDSRKGNEHMAAYIAPPCV